MPKFLAANVFCLLPVSLGGQWLHVRQPGIPRTADGKANLTAPAPRSADGTPDLSGLWAPTPNLYWLDIIRDLKDEAIFKPAAEAVFQKRIADYNPDAPYTRCLPLGAGDLFTGSVRILQSATEVALLHSGGPGDDFREVFMDGRELPRDPEPTWRGYSVGRWEGDTLVVQSAGFNDSGWLDQVGHPRSEKLQVTERFRRVDLGHIELQITFDDPGTLTRPVTLQSGLTYMPDTSMLELVCNENEKDRAHSISHFAGEAQVRLSTAELAKYTGDYGLPQGPTLFVVSLVKDQLYLADLPLYPQTESRFETSIAAVEFAFDAGGAVTSLTLPGAAGDEFTLTRKR